MFKPNKEQTIDVLVKDLARIVKEMIEYVRENKKIWLIPVVLALVVIGFLIATAGSSPVPVFVYPVV